MVGWGRRRRFGITVGRDIDLFECAFVRAIKAVGKMGRNYRVDGEKSTTIWGEVEASRMLRVGLRESGLYIDLSGWGIRHQAAWIAEFAAVKG